jgi:hypothetical protein
MYRTSTMTRDDDRYQDEALVTIATFETEIEASFARGALAAIGIPALVPGEAGGSFSGMYGGMAHTAQLQVFESDRDRALLELRRLQIRIVPPRHRA